MKVGVSGPLRQAVGNLEAVDIEASTIRELLERLVDRYPMMHRQVEDGIAVAINGTIYRDDQGIAIPPDAEVFLLPRIQGG